MPFKLQQEYLVSYDIEDNKIRTQLFKELEKYGLRPVQKSVFWGYLTLAELKAIQRYLDRELETSDRAFITQTHFNKKGQSYIVGHRKDEFQGWLETDVI